MIIERNGKQWHWAKSDKKLIQVFDWVDDIQTILAFVKNRHTCIQAGGAMGQWPVEFSKYFDEVITFEPQVENFDCLEKNIEGIENIAAYPMALDSHSRTVSIHLDECEQGNSGAYFVIPGGEIPSITIDAFDLKYCDLIQLDVEGYECSALKGGEQTILKYKPTIVIEEKPLPHMSDYQKARRLLESWDYSEVGRIHKDVIFKRN